MNGEATFVRFLKENSLMLVLMRHGHYSTASMNNYLDEKGCKQIQTVGTQLAEIVRKKKFINGVIVTSDTYRTAKSGEILSKILEQPMVVEDCFLGKEDIPGVQSIIKEILKLVRLDYLVIVGNQDFLEAFAEKKLGMSVADEWGLAEYHIWNYSNR